MGCDVDIAWGPSSRYSGCITLDKKSELTLTLCRFRMCGSAYSQDSFVTKAMPMMLSQSSQDTHRAVAVLRCPGNTCPVKVKQGSTLPSCLSSHSVNKCHFTVYLLPCFPHFYAFCLWLPFKISLECSIGRMSNVTESKEAVQCLLEKRNRQERMVWDKVKLRIRGSSGNPMRFSKEGSDKIF